MSIVCSKCKYLMTKSAAFGYFFSDILYFSKTIYVWYTSATKGIVQGWFVTALNLKQIPCPVCLKFKGWSESDTIN